MNRNQIKYFLWIIIVGIIVPGLTSIRAQDVFIVKTLKPDEYYSYQNLETGEIIQFDIVEQLIHGEGTDAIFVNKILTNRTSITNSLPKIITSPTTGTEITLKGSSQTSPNRMICLVLRRWYAILMKFLILSGPSTPAIDCSIFFHLTTWVLIPFAV